MKALNHPIVFVIALSLFFWLAVYSYTSQHGYDVEEADQLGKLTDELMEQDRKPKKYTQREAAIIIADLWNIGVK